MMKNLLLIVFCIGLLTTVGNSQVIVSERASAISKVNTELIAASSAKVVKNSPFSAEGISESVQVLADGNRITKSSTVKMFRDSEGRFRREGSGSTGAGSGFTTAGTLGLIATYGFQNTISINDPVASVRYILYPSNKTARRYENKNNWTKVEIARGAEVLKELEKYRTDKSKTVIELKSDAIVMGNIATYSYKPDKPESLGTKMIEGVEAEGTRTVKTIAAGSIGNELPIEITYEKWYSKELDLIVYSRNYDPRYGEQTYRLVNIDRSEPDSSLFTVPSDYKIVEEKLPKLFAKPK